MSWAPSAVWATQPGFTLSGTTSTRVTGERATEICRRSADQAVTSAGVPVVPVSLAASGPLRSAPSAMNAGPGLISNSWLPAGSASGVASQARAATGRPSSRSSTLADTEVCTNRPEAAITGP